MSIDFADYEQRYEEAKSVGTTIPVESTNGFTTSDARAIFAIAVAVLMTLPYEFNLRLTVARGEGPPDMPVLARPILNSKPCENLPGVPKLSIECADLVV